MSPRVAAVLWLLIGVAVWNGFFDLYVSRGAREYLQLEAEAELGRTAAPSMVDVMTRNRHAGATAATVWAVVIVGAGWVTVATTRRPTERRA